MNLSLHRLFVIAIAMMAVGMFSSSANAQGARLLYNPSDGNVQIEINEMLIQTFQIETRAPDVGTPSRVYRIDANVDPEPFGQPSFTDANIDFTDTSNENGFALGTFDIGNVFLPNLTFSNEGTLTTVSNADGDPIGFGSLGFTVTGSGSNSFSAFEVVEASSVPEPTTLPLLAIGATAFLKRRRKR